jgi:hypothetical protein
LNRVISIWKSVFAATAVLAAAVFGNSAPVAAQSSPPTAEELLGFSRYLPEDVDGYVSLMQMGRLVRSVEESKAWSQLRQVPEIKQVLDQWTAMQAAGKIPQPVLMAVDLLRSAGESEVTVAVRPDVSKNLLAVARLFLSGAVGFAPSRLDPDSPQGAELARRQAELRQELVTTFTSIRIPSIIVAARVHDSAKYEPFVRVAVEQGRAAMLEEMKRGMPPEIFAKFEAAFAPAKVGNASLWRFHMRLGDIIPEQAIIGEMRRSPFDESEKAALATAAASLTLNVQIGFIGEYLTLAVSSDDELVRQIVDRHEGRAQNSLAASAAFAPIRAETAADTIGILYGDATALRTELRDSLLPYVRSLTTPESLALMGVPQEVSQVAVRVTGQLETAIASMPNKQVSVLHLDRGLRHWLQQEFDREPAAAPTTPLLTVGAVPATATGYVAWRSTSLDPLWDQIRMIVEQGEAQMGAMQKRFGNPEFAARMEQTREKYRAVLRPIADKLAPSTRGEMAIVVGPFVRFSVDGAAGKEIPQVSIPSIAVLILSPSPDQAIEGFQELYQASVDLAASPRDAPAREALVTFDVRSVDGIDARVLAFPKAPLVGIEPHVTKLGQGLVISSSFELTKQIREAASARAPGIATTAPHQAVAAELPATADQLSYVDGVALVRNFRTTADQLFTFAETQLAKPSTSVRDREQFASIRRAAEAVFNLASTFRGAHSSIVSEGRTSILKERIRFEDVTE